MVVSPRRHALAGKRVLIVEDEALLAMDHAMSLAEAGAEIVGTFATVRGALAYLDKAPIDVAVVDFVLADRNSEPLQAALKARQIPFVVVSAFPPPLVRTGLAQDVLQKPVAPWQLCRRVEAVCRRGAKGN